MADPQTHLIIGAGLAGAKAAETLRAESPGDRVVLVGDERRRPYERPPLSKGYLGGSAEAEEAYVHPDGWYAEHDVELLLGRSAVSIDRAGRQVRLDSGDTIGYDRLLLTPGASPRRVDVPGASADGVYYLRTFEDSDRLKSLFTGTRRIAVIGAGWIGLEVTAAARTAGVEVTVLERSDAPLLGVLGPRIAEVFATLHQQHEVDLRCGVAVAEITTDGGRATGVRLTDGSRVPADAVIVGIGAVPRTVLAEEAGLAVSNGVVADAGLRTEDERIYAAGDVVSAYHPFYESHLRVEHWANALHQPVAAARSMLGQDVSYDRLPYFFTDQYDLGMEYLGHLTPDGYDQVVVRGDTVAREFVAFWLLEGRLVAGMNVNIWDVTDPIKKLITDRTTVDPGRLADTDVPLESLATDG
jgi:3-phenylpropionate/trans-cinnamate dioxygenase ferredoxin reductase subunit